MRSILHLASLRSLTVAASVAFGMLLFLGAPARADNFTFSFINWEGNVNGTVTGEIIGLTNNTTGHAQVIITSYPAGLESVFPSGPIDTSSWDNQVQNSFTETNGVITAADFWALKTIDSFPEGAQFYLNGGFDDSDYNFLNLDGADHNYVFDEGGFGTITFAPLAPAVAPTPEPSSLFLLATGATGLLGVCGRKTSTTRQR
jgi:hypothetical protein